MDPALGALLLPKSQAFFDALVAETVQALLHDARVPNVTEADRAVKLGR